ncbi:MAG: class I SAM-dependent methyltransferase [Candidatus Methanoperedens sp.]|nr:class I SAM-dependent methyltransferase [Candidatus Methanoperedens sp.]
MTEKQTTSEFTGTKGRIMAWVLNSPLRTLIEVRLLGMPRSAFLNEVSHHIRGDEVVLDVGAGSGYFSLAIAKKLNSGKVICFDLSEEMLQRLKHKAKKEGLENRIQIMNGEASSLDLNDESVDLVVSSFAFHEVSSPETVLMEMIRVLKPNGWVIITDYLKDTWLGKMATAYHSADTYGLFSVNELEALFAKCELKDVRASQTKSWIIGMGKK